MYEKHVKLINDFHTIKFLFALICLKKLEKINNDNNDKRKHKQTNQQNLKKLPSFAIHMTRKKFSINKPH